MYKPGSNQVQTNLASMYYHLLAPPYTWICLRNPLTKKENYRVPKWWFSHHKNNTSPGKLGTAILTWDVRPNRKWAKITYITHV